MNQYVGCEVGEIPEWLKEQRDYAAFEVSRRWGKKCNRWLALYLIVMAILYVSHSFFSFGQFGLSAALVLVSLVVFYATLGFIYVLREELCPMLYMWLNGN